MPLPKDLRAALFDFDGTLFDASRVICFAFNTVLKEFALDEIEDKHIKSMIGRPLKEMFHRVAPQFDDGELDRCVERYRIHFGPLAVPLSRPLPGAVDLVKRLHAGRVRLAVVTTRASQGARRILEGFDLLEYFSTIIGLEHVVRPKPDPEPVRQALAVLEVDPQRAVMIGDTPDDMFAGQAAGVSTIGVASGTHTEAALKATGADAVLRSLEDTTILFPVARS